MEATKTPPPTAGRSLRLVMVSETYPPEVNGVAMTVGRMVAGLLARGHRVQVVHPRQGGNPPEDGAEHVLTPGLHVPGYREVQVGLPAGRTLARRWRAEPVDVVHIDTEGPLGRSALRTALRLGIPVVSSFHTNFHQYSGHYGMRWFKGLVAGYLRDFHNRTAETLVPTGEMAEQLTADGYRNLAVLGRGVDIGLFQPGRRSEALRRSWGAAPDTPVVLYTGRLAPEKDLPGAVEIFRSMQGIRPDLRFVLVGDGPLRQKLAAAHPDLVFAGTRRGEDLATHYASADIFLFPSLTETFGNVVLEAMASGLAVVTYDCAAAREHVTDGRSGLLAPPGESRTLGELARGLVQDPQRIRALGAAAAHEVERVSWANITQRFEEILLRQVEPEEEPHVRSERAAAAHRA